MQLVEMQKEVVTLQIAFRHDRLAHDGHVPRLDGVVVFLQAERVHVQAAVQVRDRARTDRRVLVVGYLQLLERQLDVLFPLVIQARERPDSVALEERVVTAGKHAVENLVVAVLAVVIHAPERLDHLARGCGRDVERRERGLARAAFDDLLQVAEENVLSLRGEVEDHVHVERVEIRDRLADALEDFLARTVLVVAVHLLEQVVVETLHADGQTLDATLQLVEPRLHEMVGVGLRRHFLDAEVVARKVNRLAQLVEHDGRRTAADVEALEVVAQILEHHHFLAHVLEIRTRNGLAERIAIEAAIRTKHLTKRHVHVEHVLLAGLRAGEELLVGRMQVKVLLGDAFDQVGEHSFG